MPGIDNNKRFINKLLSYGGIALFLLVFEVPLYAGEIGNNVFTFLEIGEGAKPAGMAGAYTALANDVYSIHWNPAGLGKLTCQEISTSYLSYIVGINSGCLSYALPTSGGGLGLSVVYLDGGKIPETTNTHPLGDDSAYYRPQDIAMILSYGRKINHRLSMGMNLKGIYENIHGYTAHGLAVDLGTIYEASSLKSLRIGFTVKNLGLQTKSFIDEKFDLPLLFDLGLGYSLFSDSLKLGMDYLYQPTDETFNVNIGGEYCWGDLFSLRTGYRSAGRDLKTGSSEDKLNGFCFGLGINIEGHHLDYAFIPFNKLGATHRVSLSMQWKAAKIKEEKPKARKWKTAGRKYYNQGQKYYRKGKYKKAIMEYKRALMKGYITSKVYEMAGYCYHKLGKKASARRAYKLALKLDPHNQRIIRSLRILGKNNQRGGQTIAILRIMG